MVYDMPWCLSVTSLCSDRTDKWFKMVFDTVNTFGLSYTMS